MNLNNKGVFCAIYLFVLYAQRKEGPIFIYKVVNFSVLKETFEQYIPYAISDLLSEVLASGHTVM